MKSKFLLVLPLAGSLMLVACGSDAGGGAANMASQGAPAGGNPPLAPSPSSAGAPSSSLASAPPAPARNPVRPQYPPVAPTAAAESQGATADAWSPDAAILPDDSGFVKS